MKMMLCVNYWQQFPIPNFGKLGLRNWIGIDSTLANPFLFSILFLLSHYANIPAQAASVWNALKNAYEQERFPQMLLLDGQAGIGKKLLAINLAKMLCEHSSEPIIWLTPIDGKAEDRDAPAKIYAKVAEFSQKFMQNPYHIGYITESAIISVGMVEHLLKNFELKAAGNRTVLITSADLMNEQAANKLLKTFEEVPPNTYFILTANSRHSLLPTIRSRSTCFSIPFLSNSEITETLVAYGYTAPSEDIFKFATGSAGKAMLAIDSNYSMLKEKIVAYADYAIKGDASAAILYVQTIEKDINTAVFFLEGLALHLLETCDEKSIAYIQNIHFLLYAILAKKISTEHAIQNMALRMAQKAI
jgi:DNA polymerase III delta prime subunit